MGRVIPFKPYKHMCPPGSAWRKKGICPLCVEHEKKLKAHLRASRLRVKMRKAVVKDERAS